MTNKRILWVSRHQMTEEQLSDIARIMGTTTDGLNVTQYSDTVRDISELKPYLDKCDAACVVFPPELLSEFWTMASQMNVPVYTAKNRRDRNEAGEFVFVHDGWFHVDICKFHMTRA